VGLEPDLAFGLPDRFAGRYRFFDDGWTGVLRLHLAGLAGRELRGEFASDRFNKTYSVTGTADPDVHHRAVLTIHEYNDLEHQVYDGHLFTHGGKAIAGRSLWHGQPFGFFALRTARLALPTYRTGTVVPQDFAGYYSLYVDGRPATLHLDLDSASRLAGKCQFAGTPRALPVDAEVSAVVPYEISVRIGEDPEHHLALTGYLFTRPKCAIAGSAVWRGATLAFFMLRFR
jgi:hypothetical protein